MSRVFRDDQAVCSSDSRRPTKAEIKDSIKRTKTRLKDKNKEMDILALMYNGYDYNRSHVNELVGACYIAMSYLEDELKRLKRVKS